MRRPWCVLALLIASAAAGAQTTVSVYFAGDMMQHRAQLDAARLSDGTYNYSSCFTDVLDEIRKADFAVCNLETTLAGPPYSGYPAFCSPSDFATAIRDAGFDIFLTANNHCMDRGGRGLACTADVLDSLGIPHLGTYRDRADRDTLYPYIIEKEGARIALLNYTYDTNGIAVPYPRIVNFIDTAVIARDIALAHKQGADCIIACMHWGTEYRTEPDYSQTSMEQWLYAHGVSHIIGGHPHVVQPVRTQPSICGYADRHLTVWSLGNYISNMTAPRTDHGLAVTLHFVCVGNVVRLTDYELHPNRTTHPDFRVVRD